MNRKNAGSNPRKAVAAAKFLLLLCIVAGIPAFLYLKYGSEFFSADTAGGVLSFLRANRHYAFLILIGLQVIQVVVCFLPGQPIQFAASYMLGVGTGFLLSVAGAVIGTAISFFLARLLGSEAVHVFFGEETVQKNRNRLNSARGLLLAFLVYLIPGVPKDLVSYVAGISEMRFRPFLLASVVGRSPAMLGSLLVGHFYGRQNYNAIILLIFTIALILLACYIRRDAIMGFLDRIEMKEAEHEEKHNG